MLIEAEVNGGLLSFFSRGKKNNLFLCIFGDSFAEGCGSGFGGSGVFLSDLLKKDVFLTGNYFETFVSGYERVEG